MDDYASLSRRERQIMDIVYARGQATVGEALSDIPDPPSRATVRTLLRILEEKGHLTHRKRGREFVYRPIRRRSRAGRSALRRVVHTFFGGSLSQAVASHLADENTELPREELETLARLIRRASERDGDS